MLALEIIRNTSSIPFSDTVAIVRKQIIRSSTSSTANYRAVRRARSLRERFAKLCIVVEEADETLFWLEMFKELKLLPDNVLNELILQSEEIIKSNLAYRKKLKQSLTTHHQ